MELNEKQKSVGKVKLRNLDPEVVGLIHGAVQSGQIAFKDLTQDMQSMLTRILNTGSSGAGYNDAELRNLISQLDYNKADKNALKPFFNKSVDKVTKEMLDAGLGTKISNVATTQDLASFRPTTKRIEFGDLTDDLQQKMADVMKIAESGVSSGKTAPAYDKQLAAITQKVNEQGVSITSNAQDIKALQDQIKSVGDVSGLAELTKKNDTNEKNIKNISDKLEDLLGENIPGNTENGKFGYDHLKQVVIDKISKGVDALVRVDAVEKRVTVNEGNITSVNNRVDTLTKDLTDAQKTVADNKTAADRSVSKIQASVDALDSKYNGLSIDMLVKKNNTKPDNGKVQREHIAQDILDEIDKVNGLDKKIDTVYNAAVAKSDIVGESGKFVYKNDAIATTKDIINFIRIIEDGDKIMSYRDYTYPILNTGSNSIYVWEANNQQNKDKDAPAGQWTMIDQGMKNALYNYTFLFDVGTNRLYYNNNAQLQEISLGQTKSTDVTIQKNTYATVNIKNAAERVVNVLVLDEDDGSATKGYYINCEALASIAYGDLDMRIYNESDDEHTFRVIYK